MQRAGNGTQSPGSPRPAATFAGGVDYIAWKINRHAGTDIRSSPGSGAGRYSLPISLLPRLLRSGAVR
jgi:hypothetical protein